MVSNRRMLALALLALAATGCATVRLAPSVDAPAPALTASVPTADQLAEPYRAKAQQLQGAGRLRQAAEAWTTSLALAPGHEPSRQALKRLRERIDRDVAEHVRQGWHALGRDGAAEARRHFLAALALDPDSREAREALRATPAVPASAAEPRTIAPEARPARLTAARLVPQPRDGSSQAADPEALYAAARAHLAAGRDDGAYRLLVQLARVSPGYRDSAALLRDLRPRLIRRHYQDGLRLFREELIEEAIEQWRAVLEIDPGHVDARRNIEQAEKMLRTLAAQTKR
jgi:tetratricopeptide (TPR) repeat protein